jgi:SnoaL-like domain
MGGGIVGYMDTSRLADIEAIKRVKAEYFYFLDTKQWDRLRTVFTDDAEFDPAGEGAYTFDGLDGFMKGSSRSLANAISVHHGHMPIIDLLSATEATGIWAMTDYVDVTGKAKFVGYGHYHERYRKVGDTWKISSWKLTRLRVDSLPLTE